MSEIKNPLEAMLAQYEQNNKPKFEKKSEKVYDLKNYFNTFIEKGVKGATKEIRILATQDGSSPFVEFYGHKIQVEGAWKTFACLQHEKGEPCPFCEAREALLATGEATDKELAKKYNAKLMYIVKVIDRENEEDGVKFWRFNHDYRKEGILDKIQGLFSALKKDKDITNPQTGRDLALSINRNQNDVPVVSAVVALDSTPLSEDTEKVNLWLGDTRTWEDVYALKPYSFLEIIVKGGVPVWDKEEKKFVDKESLNGDEEAKQLDAELTMGVENVKAGIKTAEPKATKATKAEKVDEPQIAESEGDDLPF